MRCIISKEIKWHMGHRVPNHKSKCRSMHGHTYYLTAHVLGIIDETAGTSNEGMVMDFGDVKSILMSNIYDVLDHGFMLWEGDTLVAALLSDPHTKLIIVTFIPTAENIARWCFDRVKEDLHIPEQRRLLKVVVKETPTSAAEYSEVQMDGRMLSE